MKRGLAVGISQYPFGELKGCVEDADAFANIMRFHGSDKEGEKGDENFRMDVKPDITRGELRRLIRNLFQSDADMAVFYFSGHGQLTETGGYILTSDSEEDDPGVPMDYIMTLANRSNARDRVIILDCCNSGAFAESNQYDASPSKIQRGVTILTASSENQSAFQINGKGAFTTFLIDALNGNAADLAGQVTPGSIYTYVDKMLGLADEQRPIFKTNVSRFTVLRKVVPQVPISVLRKLTKYFPEADDKYELNPSYEFKNTKKEDGIPPYAKPGNVVIFKELQKLQSIGLVVPHEAEFMYFAAMNSKSCKLTDLGKQYWTLLKRAET